MSESKRKNINVDKSGEMRTEEISEMIDEGGLGADKYYNVTKTAPKDQEESGMIDEGGLGSSTHIDQEESIDNFTVSPSDKKEEKKKKK